MRAIHSILAFALLCSINAYDAETALGEQSSELRTDHTINAIAIVNWRVDFNLEVVCIVTEKNLPTEEKLVGRRLTFYKKDKDRLEKLFEYATAYSFLNIYPLGEVRSRLFTSWVGGSAYHLYVFAFVDGKIKQVLESGSKQPPEFLLDKNGNEIILVTQTTRVEDKKTKKSIEIPNTTKIFKWNRSKYTLIKTVPWQSRLAYVQKYLLK